MKRLFPHALALVLAAAAVAAQAQQPMPASAVPQFAPAPFPFNMMMFPFPGYGAPAQGVPVRDYQMSRVIARQEKNAMMRNLVPMLSMMGFGNIRSVMNYMAIKYPAKEGVSFDDAVESMKLRANALNFKLVGHSPMWKDFKAVLGDETAPRVEVFHYCDIAAGRELLKLAPESVVYLPCRIAVMEDADKKVWVLTLDWDMAWLDSVQGSMGINPALSKFAIEIRDKMDNIMKAAANGDL